VHYWFVTDTANTKPSGWKQITFRVMLIVLGIGIAASIGAFLALTIAGDHQHGLGLWLRDFARSPGATALAAIAAAALAFYGITRQIRVTRETIEQARQAAAATLQQAKDAHESERAQSAVRLEHERSKSDEALKLERSKATATMELQRNQEQSRSWWQSFEWATSRSIASGENQLLLPDDVSISTLQALKDEAKTPVQIAACQGVVDVITKRIMAVRDETSDEAGLLDNETIPDADARIRTEHVLERWVKSSRSEPSRSIAAESYVYEQQVLEALRSIQRSDLRFIDGREARIPLVASSGARSFIPDAMMNVSGKDVLIETKSWRPSTSNARMRVPNVVEPLRGKSIRLPLLIVTPVDVELQTEMVEKLAVRVVRWEGPEDNDRLVDALVRTAGLEPWSMSA
jgi:hypothetical protein